LSSSSASAWPSRLKDLFDELRAKAATWPQDEAFVHTRFNANDPINRLAAGHDIARSADASAEQPVLVADRTAERRTGHRRPERTR
jgi:hypothetical protein